MSKTNDAALPKREDLPEAVVKMADILRPGAKITDTGVLELADDAYAKTLDGNESLTMDVVNALQKHNSNVLPALALLTGEMSEKWCPKHKDIGEVTATLKVGKDTMSVVYSHAKSVTKPGKAGEPVETVVKHGVIRPFYEAHAAGPNRGALKKVRDYISACAEAAAAG